MLLDIAKLPTDENSAIHLHPSDNVAVARVPVAAGTELRIDSTVVVTRDAIPAGHKVSLRAIRAGEMVQRYGQAIGRAKESIAPGQHVHTHNLAFEEPHLNVSAAIILGLGCETNQIDHYLGSNAPASNRLAGLTLQSSGGTRGTVDASRRQIARFIEQAAAEHRTEVPASKIVLGLNCGG